MRTPFLLPLALSWACSADYGAVGDADYGDDTDASPGDGPSLDKIGRASCRERV